MEACAVAAGGVARAWPDIMNGRAPTFGGVPDARDGGADAGGNSPRDLKAAMRGFSAAGCIALLA